MPQYLNNLFVDQSDDSVVLQAFADHEVLSFHGNQSPEASILTTLVLRVSRKPKDLLAHLRRIYFCYQNALPEPLFAALLDLLIVLDQKGQDLSRRLLWGSRSVLNEEQQACLKNLVQGRQVMRGNRFSVFTKGVVGVSSLLEVKRQVQAQHDYLGLAADFIEYSQLEEAMDILEQGLEQTPDRQDFQALLLELYKSTESSERFQKQYDWMLESGEPLIDQWQQLAVFFNGKSS